MHNIQFIRAPFVSAFNIFDYVEGLNLGVSISGTYNPAEYYADDFQAYSTGTRNFFSGNSGTGYLFIGSGYSFNFDKYYYDLFEYYKTGTLTGTIISSGILVSGNFSGFAFLNADLFKNDIFLVDDFDSYPTGELQSGYYLSGNLLYSGYSQSTGLFAGKLYSYKNSFFDGISGYTTGYKEFSFLDQGRFYYSATKETSTYYASLTNLTGYTFQRSFAKTGLGRANKNPYDDSPFNDNPADPNPYVRNVGGKLIPNLGLISGALTGLQGSVRFNTQLDVNNTPPVPITPPIISGEEGPALQVTKDYISFNGVNYAGNVFPGTGIGTLEIRFKKYGFYTPSGSVTDLTTEPLAINIQSPYNWAIARGTGNNYKKFTLSTDWDGLGARALMTTTNEIDTNYNTISLSVFRTGIGVEFTSGKFSLYTNGILDGTGIFQSPFLTQMAVGGGTFPPVPAYLAFGGFDSSTSPFFGEINEIRLWGYVRSSGQIFANYNNPINWMSETGLNLYLKL